MSKTSKTLGQLKGSVSQDFQPTFFHDSNPSRPLINRLIYFRIRFRFRRDIRIFKKLRRRLRGLHHIAESCSAVCIPLRSQALQCATCILPESKFSNFVIEYLSEIETDFEKAQACLSGAQMGSNHEQKILVTHSL